MSPDRRAWRQHLGHDAGSVVITVGIGGQFELERVITSNRTGWSRMTGIRIWPATAFHS